MTQWIPDFASPQTIHDKSGETWVSKQKLSLAMVLEL